MILNELCNDHFVFPMFLFQNKSILCRNLEKNLKALSTHMNMNNRKCKVKCYIVYRVGSLVEYF